MAEANNSPPACPTEPGDHKALRQAAGRRKDANAGPRHARRRRGVFESSITSIAGRLPDAAETILITIPRLPDSSTERPIRWEQTRTESRWILAHVNARRSTARTPTTVILPRSRPRV